MAYTLYITRPPHYAARLRRKITPTEWAQLLSEDPELRSTETAVIFRPGPDPLDSALHWRQGNILCANPDEPTVDKMVRMAALLHAQVQGEDGELYTSGTDHPHLLQLTMFERVSLRLRVRFPMPPRGVVIVPAEVEKVGDDSPVDVDPLLQEPEKNGAPHRSNPLPPSARRWRMAVGFPATNAPPSKALASLLQPLQRVSVPPEPV